MNPRELATEYQNRPRNVREKFRFSPRPTWQKESPVPLWIKIRKAMRVTRQWLSNHRLRRRWCASFTQKGADRERVPSCERLTKEDRENMKTIVDDFRTHIDSDGDRS